MRTVAERYHASVITNREADDKDSCLLSLEAENARLKGTTPDHLDQAQAAADSHSDGRAHLSLNGDEGRPSVEHESPHNPLLQDEAWFVPVSDQPYFLGEAACTAFATRGRQALLASPSELHVPRTQFIKEAQLSRALQRPPPWPSRQQAQLWVETVISKVGSIHYFSQASTIRALLARAYKDPTSLDVLANAKLLVLFALGQVHLEKRDDVSPPGLEYYAQAMTALGFLPEQPVVGHVEVHLLLAIYSLYLNRKICAYRSIGTAQRLGLILGLHLNISESQLPDRAARQHRICLWWSVYIIDRVLSAKSAFPTSISDDAIEVDLPGQGTYTAESDLEDFIDIEYQSAAVGLAKTTSQIISTLYGRKPSSSTFSKRVQKVLQDINEWFEALPGRFQPSKTSMTRQTLALQLFAHHVCIR